MSKYPAATTLQTGISSGASSLTPYSLAGLNAPCYVVIDQEIIYCPSAPVGGAFTGVTRGALQTNPAAHVATAPLYGLFSNLFPFGVDASEYLNAIAAELGAIEIKTSGGGGIVTAVTGTLPIVSSGGTAPNISINAATIAALGAVQPDGITIDISAGVISVPTATTAALGLVQPDGTTITISAGVISAPGSGVSAVTGTAPIVSSGGSTPAISINAATTAALGAVQPDGTTIDVSAGVISVPTATTAALGLVQPDGTTITISAGVISAASSGVASVTGTAPIVSSGGSTPAISINAATTAALGAVKPDGATIDVSAGVISVPTATTAALGLVQPDGTTITISAGVISAASSGVASVTGTAPIVSSGGSTPAISISAATTAALGAVKPDGTTIDVSIHPTAGVISVPTATTAALGLVQPDGTTITISAGVISAAGGGGGAMTQIAQQTLVAPAASVTFSSIAASFSQLMLVVQATSLAAVTTDTLIVQFNGDAVAVDYQIAQTNYNSSGNSSGAPTGTGIAGGTIGNVTGTGGATGFLGGAAILTLPAYAQTLLGQIKLGFFQSAVNVGGSGTDLFAAAGAIMWKQTNTAISAIALLLGSAGNFATGSVFTLYGLQ